MMTAPSGSREVQDALAAIDRLVHRHKLMTPEQALQAARFITGDASFEFPPSEPPAPPPTAPTPSASPPSAPAAEPEAAPAAPPAAPPPEGSP